MVKEYRGDLLDLTHFGYLVIVDENSKVLFSVGDPDDMVFYRSASKPIQALPVMTHHMVEKYGITPEESVIFAGSHAGEPFHIAALESVMKKAGLSEDLLVMKPAVPAYGPANEDRIRRGLPPRKLYHNCSGKHTALMLVQRELGGDVRDYWRMGAPAQVEVQHAIEVLSETNRVQLGVDGCGVPVFAVPIRCIANAYKNLAAPEKIQDDALQEAATAFVPRIHQYPHMMRGTGYVCSLINHDSNIVGKGGANSVYGFGLKREKLGVSFKITDGTEHTWPLIILEVLKGLNLLSDVTKRNMESFGPYQIFNDNDTLVGRREVCFKVDI